MRGIRKLLGWLLVLALALGIGIFAASELGGEVVTLHTHGPDGEKSTRIWIVDDAGFAWLRAGTPANGWLVRIDADPNVVVERNSESTRFRAVPVRDDPTLRDRIHALMREKYTWADQLVSLMRDGSSSVPIRLEPIVGDSAPPPGSAP